jgi:3'-phosphoadenosine 5'-phosphosulfate sulfotransferase (PAPS reductase)/FAD synthetase
MRGTMLLHPEEKIIEDVITTFEKVLEEGFIAVLLYSAGKDSEVCLGTWLIAIQRLIKRGIKVNKQFLITADTLVENPEVDNLKYHKLTMLKDYCALHCIPLEIHVSSPSIMSTWQSRVIGGRGLPTTVNSTYRQCTHELKIDGNEKTLKNIKNSLSDEEKNKLFLVLGSRDEEGTIRANNIAKENGASDILTKGSNGENFLYPIKHLCVDEIWYFLSYSGTGPRKKWLSYMKNHDETILLYKDSAGECVILQPDSNEDNVTSSNHSSCGNRHGCWTCLATGDSGDKSMANFLKEDRYSYMQPLNDIRNYIHEMLKDYTKRRVAGRTINFGHIKLQPDCLSASECRKLLKACLTADAEEELRAQIVSRKLDNKELMPTEYNLRMSNPQFQIISAEQLVAIDWNWMLIGLFEQPHEALKVYQEVRIDMEHYYLPLIFNKKQTMPPARYLPVGSTWYDNYELEGLSSPLVALLDEPTGCLSGMTISDKHTGKSKVIQQVRIEDTFSIDPEGAELIIAFELDRLIDKRNQYTTPNEGIHTYMRYGTIALSERMLNKYDQMVTRAAKFRKLGLSADLTWMDVQSMGISKAEFDKIDNLMSVKKVSVSYLTPVPDLKPKEIIANALNAIKPDLIEYVKKYTYNHVAMLNNENSMYGQSLFLLQRDIELYIKNCDAIFLNLESGSKKLKIKSNNTDILKYLSTAKFEYNNIKKTALEKALYYIQEKINKPESLGNHEILDKLFNSSTQHSNKTKDLLEGRLGIVDAVEGVNEVYNQRKKPSLIQLSVFSKSA